jgi:crotonobetainyl-CoA:carnitine CoA-transferase CaiB-like acyl-CoA transferase
MRAPLAGVRVVDLTRLLPGPYLTQVLVDLGAHMIKLEDPASPDPMRAYPARYAELARGKRCLALDLKDPAGLAAARVVLARADVVVEGFRPGVMERLGLGYAALAAVNPRLIMLSLSGFGQDGPAAARAGHDLGYQALAGTLALGGGRLPGVQVADFGSALWALAGLGTALFARERSGQGQWLDISLAESALALASGDLAAAMAGEAVGPGRDFLHGGLAGYRVYPCQDGLELAVGALEPRFWLAFNAAIGRQASAAEVALPVAEQERIAGEILAILATAPRAAWLERLAGADCCVEPVLEPREVAAHPQHVARGVFAGGAARNPLAARLPGLPAAPGAHTREILVEAGVDAELIAAVMARSG